MEKSTFSQLIKRELKGLPKNQTLFGNSALLLLVVLLIGFLYAAGAVDRIPTALLDLDNSSTSRTVIRQFQENDKFYIEQVQNYPELQALFKKGSIKAALVIPPGFSRDIKGQKGAEILLLVDGSNYIIANTAYAKANEMLLTINGGISIKTLEGKGLLPFEAENVAQLVGFEEQLLYNSQNNYSYYLTYGILGAGAFSLLMSAIGVTFARRYRAQNIKETAAGLLVFSAVAVAALNMAYLAAITVFKLPSRAGYGYFFGLTVFYGMLIACYGLLLATVAKEEVRAMQFSVFFVTPLFFVTGYTWPAQQIPFYLLPLHYLCPMSPFVNGVRAVLVMGAGWAGAAKYYSWLLAQLLFYLPLSLWLYHRPVTAASGMTGSAAN